MSALSQCRRALLPACLAFVLASPVRLNADEPWFLPLEGEATAISDDGGTVVGSYFVCCDRQAAVKWQLPSGDMHEVSLPPDQRYGEARATGVSADGRVIAGVLQQRFVATWYTAPFIWTNEGGMKRLPTLTGRISDDGWAGLVSGNGEMIVGSVELDGDKYFAEWRDGELQRTWLKPDGVSFTMDITYDGSTVVGVADSTAAWWDADRNLHLLGTLPRFDWSWANAITPDGAMIVGMSFSGSGESFHGSSFVWTADDGLTGLSNYRDSSWTSAEAMSADGKYMVGDAGLRTGVEFERVAVMRGPKGNWRLMEDVFRSVGLEDQLAGWELQHALSISADGKTIVGDGIHPDGYQASWVAHVPEPSTGALLVLSATLFAVCPGRRILWNGNRR